MIPNQFIQGLKLKSRRVFPFSSILLKIPYQPIDTCASRPGFRIPTRLLNCSYLAEPSRAWAWARARFHVWSHAHPEPEQLTPPAVLKPSWGVLLRNWPPPKIRPLITREGTLNARTSDLYFAIRLVIAHDAWTIMSFSSVTQPLGGRWSGGGNLPRSTRRVGYQKNTQSWTHIANVASMWRTNHYVITNDTSELTLLNIADASTR